MAICKTKAITTQKSPEQVDEVEFIISAPTKNITVEQK